MSALPWLPRLVSFAFGGLQAAPAATRPLPVAPPAAALPRAADRGGAPGRPAGEPGARPLSADAVELLPLTSAADSDPVGVRVLPLRPDSAWPVRRRASGRLSNPFHAFPYRAVHLGRIMYDRADR